MQCWVQLLFTLRSIRNELFYKFGEFNFVLVGNYFQSVIILDFVTVPLQVKTSNQFHSDVIVIFRTAPITLHTNRWLLLGFPIIAMFATP